MLFRNLFTRRWLFTTLLVIAALGVLVRLGFWQIDRLHQRRDFNSNVIFRTEQPPLELSGTVSGKELAGMEYRHVVVEGEYDHSYQVVLINQVYHDQYGARLLTPLRIRNSDQYILIDRGWIPADEALSGSWSQYDEIGLVKVSGMIRAPQSKPDFGRIADPTPVTGGERIKIWKLANLDQMAKQMPFPLLGVYIQQSPNPSWTRLPYRTEPEPDLTEGSHMSYAMQWFTFAIILAIGYPLYVQREERGSLKGRSEKATPYNSEELIS